MNRSIRLFARLAGTVAGLVTASACESVVGFGETVPCETGDCGDPCPAGDCEEPDPCHGRGQIVSDGTCLCDLPWGGDDCLECAPEYYGSSCTPCVPGGCLDPLECNDGIDGDGMCVCPDGYVEHDELGCIVVDRCGCDPVTSCAAGAVEAEGHVCMQLAELRAEPVYGGERLTCGVRVSWQALNVGGPLIDHFEVYRDGVRVGSTTIPMFEDWGGGPDETYSYEVTAVDRVGVESTPSPAVEIDSDGCELGIDLAPHLVREPTADMVARRCNTTQLHWEAPDDIEAVSGFRIYLNGALTHEREASSAALGGLDGLSPLADYRYSFAPTYGDDKERTGPLVHVDVDPVECASLGHAQPQRAVVFLVRFADYADQTPPFDASYVDGVLSSLPYSAAAYLREVSFGTQDLEVARSFGWVTLSDDSDAYCTDKAEQEGVEYGFFPSCNTARIASATRTVAGGLSGINPNDFLTDYDRQIYIIYGVTQGAYGGGSALWASTFFTVTEPIVHELGHTFGLRHAGNWECPGPHTVGPSLRDVWAGGCEAWIYGDAVDVMAVRLRHYSAYNKFIAGYFGREHVAIAETAGTFTLAPVEAVTVGSDPFLLTVPLDAGTFYGFEYRRPVGFDANTSFPDYAVVADSKPEIETGLAVWLRAAGLGEEPRQVPASADRRFVTVGNDFYDPYRRIRVRVVEEPTDTAIRVAVEYDAD